MSTIDTSLPVMVTGATGYVAGHLVKKLLDKGMTVHVAVRDTTNSEKLKYLNQIAQDAPGKIKYFQADLLHHDAYAKAMKGCAVVFHTASPVMINPKDPLNDLVKPATLGTRNVLEIVDKTPSVKRVVLTSSCATLFSDNIDIVDLPNGELTEAQWNMTSTLEHNPYFYSKTRAEREAWRIQEAQSRRDMVVLNPSLVIGPGINPFATSDRFQIIKQMGNGTLRLGAPHWGMGVVNVCDIAEAHFKAAFTTSASGRYIINGHNTELLDLAQTLQERYGNDYALPTRVGSCG